jgi:ParB-like chromosome segregation protein Spo0J
MTATTASLPSLTVELVPIEGPRPRPRQSATHQRGGPGGADAQPSAVGFLQPVLERRENSVVVGGHQRLVAARRLGMDTVPVIWLDISVVRARLLNVALNKISGDWDEQLLARLLADLKADLDLDLSLSGFGDDEIKELLKKLDAMERADRPESFEFDAALEEARREPRTKPGDLWALCEHRLLCGDATDAVAVRRLLADAKPRLFATDPPYGVSLDPTWRRQRPQRARSR